MLGNHALRQRPFAKAQDRFLAVLLEFVDECKHIKQERRSFLDDGLFACRGVEPWNLEKALEKLSGVSYPYFSAASITEISVLCSS